MGLTLAQKILRTATNTSQPTPGDILTAEVSAVMISEALGPKFFYREFEALGDMFFDPDKIVGVIDHYSPARYTFSISEVAKHCLEAVRPEFCQQARKGDIVLGGENFGTGSSRETAAAALKELGISLVIAKSFARIFFRNCIDIGLPVVMGPGLYDLIEDGDIIRGRLAEGRITNESQNKSFRIEPLPHTMMAILAAGGLINYAIREKW